MNLPFDTSLIPKDGMNKDAKSHVTDLLSHLKLTQKIASKNIKEAQERQKKQHDKKAITPNFNTGDLVLLHTTRMPVGLSPKLQCPWDGPYYIAATGPNYSFKLRKCSDHKEHEANVNAKRLKHYKDPNNRPSLETSPVNTQIDDGNQSTDALNEENQSY
ncbi:hypothetical protein FSP39_008753 [Pinctada imbricata]|uniref:Uncharacterized protein n=1 Tax=Pinctada imbricata TaxID=66713 RepID=A0AA88YK51_PINIB|nr:hypothetical protein FSP39_008753 [Pinctada imbricata]